MKKFIMFVIAIIILILAIVYNMNKDVYTSFKGEDFEKIVIYISDTFIEEEISAIITDEDDLYKICKKINSIPLKKLSHIGSVGESPDAMINFFHSDNKIKNPIKDCMYIYYCDSNEYDKVSYDGKLYFVNKTVIKEVKSICDELSNESSIGS